MVIESTSNKNYKYISKLKNKKYRDAESSFIVESRKLVEEAISSADIDFIFLSENNASYRTNYQKLVLSENLFNKLSSFKNPDGFGAVVKKKSSDKITNSKVLLLDHLNDPGNMGTIVRSAEAFGFSDIIITPGTVDIYNEKTLRASMGSIFRLNIKECNIDELHKLKNTYKIVAADMSGYDINKCKIDDNLILAIGNEANGLSEDIRNLTDIFVKIPMQGKIESLNAAIAASILMNKLG
ncbi:TrmH family RNA methyltransferase [Anaerococcus nagyae]|uniref:TrmH family RNA methyltransferase n=1 Tax=Anaerococcus nagyae TaxID=1755241 RepID=UPI001AE51E39|nr:RNA methyltransferase [Anaerococcus nagyae]MBP2069810.1 TrmH family RNA methyltransferase [Anaerococcus nagyae]